YSTLVLRAPKATEGNSIPMPPIGYVTKDLASVAVLEAQIARLAKQAYAAVNLEYLSLTPAEQSGIAKAYDRQEINASIAKVARHLTQNILLPAYRKMLLWRYRLGNPAFLDEHLVELTPKVVSPKSFDVLPTDVLAAELKSQRDAGMGPAILSQTEREYQARRFANDPVAGRRYELARIADPLPNYTLTEKQAIKLAGGCTPEDFVLSVNLMRFISELEFEDEFFWSEAIADAHRVERLRAKAAQEWAKIRAAQAGAITGAPL
ncbi:MAG: hypothetical protein RMM53_09830, partial [Bacteroidia bacterium]|nr:hypothetical protein [Bacteroidia bacterium]MDW8334501.1 hypothetical protein [Bacteroidia bacterium]